MQRCAKPDLTEVVCLRFCSYYKPGRNEELACAGYAVLERLALQRVPIGRTTMTLSRDKTAEELLVRTLCMACPFHEKDCDFMENRTLPPCGGFLSLSQLLAAKEISIEDVR